MRLYSAILLILLGTLRVFSQDLSFTVKAPGAVEVGEQFRVVYSVNNKQGSNLRLPEFAGFDLLAGPSEGMESGMTSVNGQTTSYSRYTYTYIFMANKEGEFTIDPATITVDGKDIKSNTIKIRVVKGEEHTNSRQQQRQQQSSAGRSTTLTEENLFLRLEVSRGSIYLGESIVATLKIYSRGVQWNSFGRVKFPAFDGFMSEEITLPRGIELKREEYNGKIYDVGVLNQRILFPQHTGEITIDPFELEVVVTQRLSSGSGSFFDSFFDNVRNISVPRRTLPVKITVKNLPAEGKPADFGGLAGSVTMSTSLSTDTVKANDAITYKIQFKGDGNLKLMDAPKINFPHDFELYDPKVSRDVRTTAGGTSGTVTFEYLLIPRFAGEYKIPSFSYSFFDTRTRSYKTLKSDSRNIYVLKGSESSSASGEAAVQSFKKEDVRVLGEDIRYIRTGGSSLKPIGVRFFRTIAFQLSLLIPFLLTVAGIFLNRRRIQANADLVRKRSKGANKMAKKRLKAAAAAMNADDSILFYQEVLNALWGYVSYKLNIAASALNRENISDHLCRKGATEEDIREFIELLDRCEFARYAPESGEGDELERVYKESMAIITKLDKAL